jgi:hypothetical protein
MTVMNRLFKNVLRLPQRTWKSAQRRINPLDRLERQADVTFLGLLWQLARFRKKLRAAA